MSKLCIPYIVARLIRRALPEVVARRFLSNDFRGPHHTIQIHQAQRAAVTKAGVDLNGATVLEIGPGRYNPACVGFLAAGVRRVILIEHVRGDLKVPLLSSRIRNVLLQFGDRTVDADKLSSADPVRGADAITFGNGAIQCFWRDAATTGLASGSVRAIFSNSVVEHLSQPESVFQELARILEPNGFMFHRVDLRDHFFRYPLQFLCYSDYTWSHVLTSRERHKAYLNRLRLPQLVEMLNRLGFEVGVTALETNLPAVVDVRPYLHADYARYKDGDLAVLRADLTCRKCEAVRLDA